MARGIDRKPVDTDGSDQDPKQQDENSETVSDVSWELLNVRKHWARMLPNSPIYSFLFSSLSFESATHGRVVAELLLSSNHINSKGTMHGVASSALVDCMGGLAIASTGSDHTGLSTDIHTSYMGGAKEGELLEIVAEVTKLGGTLAFISVTIKNSSQGGRFVATGTHTKYVKV
ncbi:MAG: hypothetical protein Q9190_003636 [Brigantiaea leucoxantha]